jgi:hypothetical protein
MPFCDDCQCHLKLNICERCGVPTFRSRTVPSAWICSSCRARAQIATVSEAEIAQIHKHIQDGKMVAAIQEARRILQLSLKDAIEVVNVLAGGG